MAASTFTPMQEHLGEVVRSTKEANNVLEGFTKSYSAAYSALSSVKASEDPAYTWSSANLFAGINPDSFETLTDARDILKVVSTTLNAVVSVLDLLDTITTTLIQSPTKILLTALEGLISRLVDLFNPTARLHLLYIPPKLGDLSTSMLQAPKETDNVLEKSSRSSAVARNALVDNLNSTLAFLPTALQTSLVNFKAVNSSLYGSNYLYTTIDNKLSDIYDKNRPYLDSDSYWVGFGIFLGSSLPNRALSYWDRLNAILDSSKSIRLPTNSDVPPKPAIQKHRVTELSRLLSPIPSQTEMSAIQESVVCYPLGPTTYYSSSVKFNFLTRLVYLSRTTIPEADLSLKSPIELVVAVQQSMSTDLDILLQVGSTATSNSDKDFILFSRDSDVVEHFPTADSKCYRFLLAVDVYFIESTETHYITRFSDPVTCLLHPRGPSGFINVDYTSGNPLTSPSISGTFPNWYSVGSVLNILPSPVGQVVNFLELFRTYVEAFSDTVLNTISTMLTNLKNYLRFINKIIARVDELIKLLGDIVSITTSLGASVVVFEGQGTTKEVSSMFKEYLDSKEERKDSFSAILNEHADKKVINVTLEDLVAAATSDVSSVGKVQENYASYIRELNLEADLKFSEQRQVVPKQVADASVYTGKKSPVFTDKDSTCGIVALATSSTAGDLLGIKSLIELLFEDSEPVVASPSAILAAAGLSVDTTTTSPEVSYIQDITPKAIFKANMELTSDPSESPFNFCK